MEKYQEETKRQDQKFLDIKATRDAMHARMQNSKAKIEADIENAKMLLEFIEVDEMKLQLKRTTRAKVAEPPVKKRVRGGDKPYLWSPQVPIAEGEALRAKSQTLQAKLDAREEAHIANLARIKH
ncbi:hypothetical protein HBH69_015870 [Parastagonospora nodorum]|nr:hypothetical protein HBI76_106740 [Parastagonospora nodorum]KAH5162467.1 hypothetical protein HBH69_015870 [Parastagonospora nodorum]KAH5232015.1 hypothetical protein HBI62_066600 [Parastagonospora nodorum]KAH5349283.1 hypothetical protein HBI49_195490 [Parastagonospora nodorum]KAH5999894.1 hypothetical protein HBI84_106500 [Parastagonospora nodorum]